MKKEKPKMAKTKKTEEVSEVMESKPELSLGEMIKAVETPGVHVRRPQPGSTAERQLAHFAAQAKVRYSYPRTPGEKAGSYETVCVNDLLITVEKGTVVSIPEDIANLFDDALHITDAALRKGSIKELPSDSPLNA